MRPCPAPGLAASPHGPGQLPLASCKQTTFFGCLQFSTQQPRSASAFEAPTHCVPSLPRLPPVQGNELSLAHSGQVARSCRRGRDGWAAGSSQDPGVHHARLAVGGPLEAALQVLVSRCHNQTPQDPGIRPSWPGSETQRGSWGPAYTPALGHPRAQVCLGSSCGLPTACHGRGFSFGK